MSFERGGAIREFNPILRNFDRLSDQEQVKGNPRPKRNSVCDGEEGDEWNERVFADDIKSSYFRLLTSISFSDPYLT